MSTRRDFLEKLSLPFLTISLLKNKKLYNKMTITEKDEPVLKVALMGLGSYATIVANAMQQCKKAKITGLISGTPDKLKEWSKKYNVAEENCYNYSSYHNIKNNNNIDAVYIITPNALHKEHTIAIANAGKHVICEKPMALNAMEAKEMIDACRKANVQLLIGYRLHFEAKTLEVIKMRQNNEFGKIKIFQGLSGFIIGDPKQWRLNKTLSGGGSLMDIGIYSLNAARYTLGEEPVWVTAQEAKTDKEKFKEGVDETIQFQMGFASGAIASCTSSYAANGLDSFFISGDKGYAHIEASIYYGPSKVTTSKGPLTQPHTTHQAAQMDGMADIILHNKQPLIPVDGEEGLKDIKIIEAIYKAAQTNARVYIQ
ncbi:MAG: glucose-fructose oxidoreductase [Chitinophaga sp.]|jgi:predicted dehydrogenase|nr:glucose-fructose oxidoreductase [Chitinophaga sp.]